MDQIQLDRWKQFSLGLAKKAYPNITPRRREKLMAEVDDCIEWVVCNGLETVDDWDSYIRLPSGGYYESASTRVDQWMWDNNYEREVEDRKGNCEVVCGRFATMIACCVRAGFDVAVAPSCGVLGYTVGDVRNIFDGDVPDWVNGFFSEPLDAAADHEGVWL